MAPWVGAIAGNNHSRSVRSSQRGHPQLRPGGRRLVALSHRPLAHLAKVDLVKTYV